MDPIDKRARGASTLVLWLSVNCSSTTDVASNVGQDAAAMDADALAPGSCAADRDCDDGLFCNGPERCAPSDPSADSHGCLVGRAPCVSTQTCNEAMDRCVSSCDRAPDADHDGHNARECGGDDCDDGDINRFPGEGREVCDPAQREHDEDCDPTTYANPTTMDGDRDGDGVVDARCCNVDRNGNRACGPDCNDMDRNIRPAQVEACNGRDDNCNGMIDEGLTSREYCRDADGDMFGSRTGGVMRACTPPMGYAADCSDCDDGNPRRNPGAPEVCDGVDNNCMGGVDEGLPTTQCCADGDGDGAVDPARTMRSCAACGAGWRQCGGPADCDDRDARAYPGQTASFTSPRTRGGYDFNCDGREEALCQPGTPCDCSMCGGLPSGTFPCGQTLRQVACGALPNMRPTCRQSFDILHAPTFVMACR